MEMQNSANNICPRILSLEPRLQNKYVGYAFFGHQTMYQWKLEQKIVKYYS